jgi:hypothetical protein
MTMSAPRRRWPALLVSLALAVTAVTAGVVTSPAAADEAPVEAPVDSTADADDAPGGAAEWLATWRTGSFVETGSACVPGTAGAASDCVQVPTVTITGPATTCMTVRDVRFEVDAYLTAGLARGPECTTPDGGRSG